MNKIKNLASKLDKVVTSRGAIYVGVGVGIAVAFIANSAVKGPTTVIIETTNHIIPEA